MLRIRNLSGGYGARPVISSVDIDVEDGETVALMGANTAGKTSVIRAVVGSLPNVTTGEIRFGGEDLSRLPTHLRVSRGIACVPEGRHVFNQMTVLDNIMMGAYHRRRDVLGADLEECYALFPRVRERGTQLAQTLSGGEQQMVAVCRALMAKPKLLVLDEPSHGLAPLMAKEVHSAISKVNARGISVLLVEQNVSSALKIVSRGYVLESGQIALSGTSEELRSNDQVRRTYLGI